MHLLHQLNIFSPKRALYSESKQLTYYRMIGRFICEHLNLNILSFRDRSCIFQLQLLQSLKTSEIFPNSQYFQIHNLS